MATTATRTTTPTTTKPPQPLPPNFLPYIDMTTLSQSELHKLSLTFSTPPSTTNNTITPTIDRTNFNESAGSRRQTFARPSHHHHRHRLAATPFTKTLPDPPNNPIPNDPDRLENPTIIKFLKNLLSSHPEFQEPDFSVEFDTFNHFNHPITIISNSLKPRQVLDFDMPPGVRKRKRGRKPKVKALSIVHREMGLEIVNRKGVVVDLVGLACLDDPYKDELKRRTEGMEKEEELLGFFRELGGQWCSRRKKRKIVDAGEFGDFLPVGWKLILGLKRKEGRAWVYCRRYLSPSGQQFISCKDVSAYLQSLVGPYDAQQAKDHTGHSIQQDHGGAPVSHAGAIERLEDQRQSIEHQKQVSLLETDNLAEVQIRDLFECHKCRMTFDEKGTYLEHLLSFHQRTTRRYRLGSSVGDGVIVKDGKFECQFCHKVFHERRRYNGHVGIHVRNYVRGIEDSPGVKNYMRGIEESPAVQLALQKSDPPTPDDLPTRISKMDALIEIAQNSIRETSSSGANDEQNVVSDSKLPASVSEHELNSDSPPSEPQMEDSIPGKSLELNLHQQKVDFMVIDEKMEKVEDASDVQDFKTVSSADAQHHNTFESLSRNDGLAPGTNEIGRSGIKGETVSESHSLAPVNTQKIFGAESNMIFVGFDRPHQHKPDEVDKSVNVEMKIGFGSNNSIADGNAIQDTGGHSFKENVLKCGVPEQQLQLPHDFSTPEAIVDKGENEFGTADQIHAKVTGFDELKLDEIEHLKFSLGTGQEPMSLHEVPLGLGNITEMEAAYDASLQFESDVIVDTADRQLTTVCVWCGAEFSHEAFDTEMQSGSVGYMCPDCKAKISGQLNI
ncbi:hypothetical protein POPTR_001G312900v4 [Populus trichocarpa]|uniref:Uncharacterized protein n=2 Tax=Populus trichocarpa TaxID=3694 RepID=A0ACC0TMI7_POPTR|nr:uncharacterized protein LOC7492017 isoform X1 [Populus trichocarpa]XP_024445386.2 uncharacterized protein LOC7492017 isoform X1 [Populus trichocarpa]XP_052302583.1 uncharacterized protein LOC7492017 isoform X1 [Populus trichocarpa]KAI9402693.1 hypothetical protein POPTR_001G312900v4 [Populus trichocarpa]KAI9402694.1 hypothetical protein POPTR_001G312900v4 [Populus trichocarpa]